jgi:hypothetical protein
MILYLRQRKMNKLTKQFASQQRASRNAGFFLAQKKPKPINYLEPK